MRHSAADLGRNATSDFCGIADESTDSVSRIIDAVFQTNGDGDDLNFGSDSVQELSPSSFENLAGVSTSSAQPLPIDSAVTATAGTIKG